MGDAMAAFNGVSSVWWDTMLAVLWQSTLLAVVVALLLTAWRGLSPALRCCAWRIVAIKILLMPFWIVTVPMPHWFAETDAPAVEVGPESVAPQVIGEASIVVEPIQGDVLTTAPASAAAVPAQLSWQAWLVAAWMVVIVIQMARLAWQRLQLRRLLTATRAADAATGRMVSDGCQQLGLGQVPEVRITDVDVSPFVCRLVRPLLVLPESVVLAGDSFQLRQIVLHELAHVRRADLAWCWITHVVRVAYWFHPVAHWIAFREALERELACDELAISHSGATAGDYAQTLVAAASRLAQPAVLRATAAAHLDGGSRLCDRTIETGAATSL